MPATMQNGKQKGQVDGAEKDSEEILTRGKDLLIEGGEGILRLVAFDLDSEAKGRFLRQGRQLSYWCRGTFSSGFYFTSVYLIKFMSSESPSEMST